MDWCVRTDFDLAQLVQEDVAGWPRHKSESESNKKMIRKGMGGQVKRDRGFLLGFDVAMDELGVVEVDEGFEDLV